VVKLERNYGQSNAIAAGLTLAAGRYIVVMDSDLQDKPEDVMLLYEKIRQSNKDMVIACRLEANGIYWRDIGSVTFYYLTMLLTRLKFPWGSGVFRIMHRRCIERLSVALRTPGTVLSFIHAAGYSWETIELPRGKVKQRDSSYNFSKMIHLAFSRIIPYSRIPIEWLGSTLLLRYLPRFSIDKIYKGADDE
jgi:dolichol-phosphate mannosyltransferase